MWCVGKVYYMGIIDFLSPYATKKKMAHLFKRGVLLNEAVLPDPPLPLFHSVCPLVLTRTPRPHTHYQRISSILYRVGRSFQRAGRLLLFSLPQSHRHHHFDVIVHSTARNCLTPNHDTLIPSLCVFLAASLTSHACRQRYRWCRRTSTPPASNSSSRAVWRE